MITLFDRLTKNPRRLALALALLLSPLAAAQQISVKLQPIAKAMCGPLDLAATGDGRLFIADQIGLIYVIDTQGNTLDEPLLDLRDRMIKPNGQYDERGLLGLVLHPDFAKNGRLFVNYSAPRAKDTPKGFDHRTHVSEFRMAKDNPNKADAGSERVVLTIDQPQGNHNGGGLAFGPDDMLYITSGDGGAANDKGPGHNPEIGNGQDKTTLLGKMLRIDVNGKEPYAIPADNPFVNEKDTRPEIWALGLRNVWRFSFDEKGRMFGGDVGQGTWEEVDIITKGGNYGWPQREGFHSFPFAGKKKAEDNAAPPTTHNFADPILEYHHSIGDIHGVSICGGFVYRGKAIPALRGMYIFGDWSQDWGKPAGVLIAGREGADGKWTQSEIKIEPNGRMERYLLAIGQDHEGELYLLTRTILGPKGGSGEVLKIVP
ncbi:MAG: PQQ-dependent sugar dehydrogenase [Phycisphaerales bacterium]|nr:PQQ-dependent sugar dehydrogenase [Phycisphaerales bacterium]